MNYTEYTDNPLGQVLIVIAAIFIILFVVLLILLPFYVQSINTWTRTSAKELEKIRLMLVKLSKQQNKKKQSEGSESSTYSIMRE